MFDVESLEMVDDIYQGRVDGYIYSRDANPNITIFEQIIAQLEQSDHAVACSSGKASTGLTLPSMVSAGDSVAVASELYGGTNQLVRQHLTKLGVTADFVDVTDLSAVERSLEKRPTLILLESITNPLLRLIDIEAISAMARRHGVKVIVDNTLAPPVLLRTLGHGADAVIHSSTRFLCGHPDVTGVIVASSRSIVVSSLSCR